MNSAETDPLRFLISRQNGDGGWGYQGHASWTEPTALALLALSALQAHAEGFARGRRWLRAVRRKDGGWAPQPAVEESTWVTALAVLAGQAEGLDWLLRQTGRESTAFERIRRRLVGVKWEYGEGTVGWSWYPGTSAWTVPTAITILALEKQMRVNGNTAIQRRIEEGREALLARICPDGGWNYGASRTMGTDASSYPETTGAALLALNGVQGSKIERGIAAAERHYEQCRATQGRSWLALALLAHGRRPGQLRIAGLRCRDAMDASMLILAEKAMQGRSVFLGETG
jgi:Prenyltransferase and squalene oxidase repeat